MAAPISTNTPTGTNSTRDIAWIASAARATSSVSSTKGVDRYSAIKLLLDVTAVTGTSPTLNVYLQTLLPDEVTWMDVASFTQKTGTGKQVLDFVSAGSTFNTPADAALTAGQVLATLLGRWIRLKYVIAGTNPSFTFSASIIFWE